MPGSEPGVGSLGLLVFWLPPPGSGRGYMMDAVGRDIQVRNFVKEVWNGRNYEAAAELYAENYVNPFGTGPAARAEPMRHYHAAFPDLHVDIDELVVAGDTVVARLTFRGTDTGGHLGRPSTGRAIGEWVVCIMHFDGDRVVNEWIGADNLGLFIQLGVLDDPWPKKVEEPAPTG
jgi:predicted ester cyclase